MALEAQEAESNANAYLKAEALLAKANLMRMRGDLAGAEHNCAEVLSQRPTDGAALAILAEVRYAQMRYDEAARLFELASQCGGDSPAVQQRLAELAPRRNAPGADRTPSYPSAVVAIVCVVGFICLIVVAANLAPRMLAEPPPVTVKITAPPEETKGAKTDVPKAEVPITESVADRTMAQRIESETWSPLKVLAVAINPRDASVVITIQSKGSDDRRRVASAAAYVALEFDSTLKTASVRIISDERVVFVADMTREKANEVKQAEPIKTADVAEACLTNEWTADSNPPSGTRN